MISSARLLLLLLAASLILPPLARAVPVYLLTQDNRLVTMDSASPGTASASVAITGIGTFNLVGMDVRTTRQTVAPANPGVGSLWALGFNELTHEARLFVINPATAAASPVGPVLMGMDDPDGDNGWFFGHDPGKDRFRLMNAQKNYELNPNTMTFDEQTDLMGFPNINGSAFTSVRFGQASQIFFVRQGGGSDLLSTSTDIAAGNVSDVGGTGLDFSLGAGLDIDGGATLLATTVGGDPNLYSINRSSGAATLIGLIAGNPSVRAIAIMPSFPATVRVKGRKRLVTNRPFVRIRGTATSSVGIKRVTYQVGKAKPKKAKGKARWNARIRVKPRLNRVAFRAIGNNDFVSRPVRVRILRR